ncbi:MAG: LmbU family transcriptional regulator [Actinomycetota bacterium]|nr:LmbU family transcriptional regulator [Actinomycetota bacterium]
MSGLALPGVITERSLELPPNLTFEEWAACGKTLKGIDAAVKWWVGDWLVYGEDNFPDKWAQAVEATDYEEPTLRKAAWVASRFPRGKRRDALSYRHHETVAALPEEERDRWLDQAEPERPGEPPRLSTRELDKAMKQTHTPRNVETVERCACPECGSVFELSRASTWTEER